MHCIVEVIALVMFLTAQLPSVIAKVKQRGEIRVVLQLRDTVAAVFEALLFLALGRPGQEAIPHVA